MIGTTRANSNPTEGSSRASRSSRLGLMACVVAAAICAPGCTEEKPRPQGLLDAEGRPVQDRPKSAPAPATTEQEQERVPAALPSPFGEGEEESEEKIAAAAPEPEKKEEPRDLEAELRALVGQPTSCLDLEKLSTGSGRVTIRVTATVLPSGSISRASASAAGQDSAVLRCVEQLVITRSLKGPIEDAPLTVSAESIVEVVKVASPATQKKEEPVRAPAPATLAQPADGAEIAVPADDTELAEPPDEDEPVELAQPAD